MPLTFPGCFGFAPLIAIIQSKTCGASLSKTDRKGCGENLKRQRSRSLYRLLQAVEAGYKAKQLGYSSGVPSRSLHPKRMPGEELRPGEWPVVKVLWGVCATERQYRDDVCRGSRDFA